MKSTKARAYSLIQILALLPLIMAATGIATHLYVRTMRIQRLEIESMTQNDAIRHIIKRFQDDAMLAGEVTLDDTDAGQTLRLARPGESIVYEVRDNQISRTTWIGEQQADGYTRILKEARIDFELETIREASKVVWIRIARQSEKAENMIPQWYFAAAARVGRGG